LRGGKGGTFMVGPGRHSASLRHCPQLSTLQFNQLYTNAFHNETVALAPQNAFASS